MGYSRKRYAYPRTKPGSLTTIVYVTKFPTANNVCAVALISHIFPSFLHCFSHLFASKFKWFGGSKVKSPVPLSHSTVGLSRTWVESGGLSVFAWTNSSRPSQEFPSRARSEKTKVKG
jgi:hypothetical protein